MTGLTRRAALRGIAATATTAAALAVPAASAATTDVEAVLAAWRQLKALQVEHQQLSDEMSEIEEALPLWVKKPRVFLMKGMHSGKEFWASTIEEIDEYFPVESMLPITPKAKAARKERRDAKVAELEEIKRLAAIEYEKAGWTWRDVRQQEIDEIESPFHEIIDEATGDHPVIIAAKLWQGLTFQSHDMFDDYPARCLIGVIRELLPRLPADMRAAMEAIITAGTTDDMHDVWRRLGGTTEGGRPA